MKKKDVALVLSGGGARGFAHIGAINTLLEQGYNITSIAGTSMGALVGGIYAAGGLGLFQEFANSLDVTEVLKLADFSISTKGIIKGRKIIERLKEMVPDRNIEDLPIPFSAVATEINTGREAVFTTGRLFDAIRASIAIPTVFQPLKIGDSIYVDGGVVNPLPINRVKRNDGDILVVVDVNSQVAPVHMQSVEEAELSQSYIKQLISKYKKSENVPEENHNEKIGLFNLATRSIFLMINRISELTINNSGADILINVSHESFGIYDFYKARDIIAEGAVVSEKALKEFESRRDYLLS